MEKICQVWLIGSLAMHFDLLKCRNCNRYCTKRKKNVVLPVGTDLLHAKHISEEQPPLNSV